MTCIYYSATVQVPHQFSVGLGPGPAGLPQYLLPPVQPQLPCYPALPRHAPQPGHAHHAAFLPRPGHQVGAQLFLN